MRSGATAATFEESGVALGDTAIRSQSLTVFLAQDEATDGVKAVGVPGIDGRTIWKIEARRRVVLRNRDQIAIGEFVTIDFRTGEANLNGNVIVAQGPNSLKGEHLFLDLRTGRSRLDGYEYWIVY
jgi:lipopolysaccharide export system protein LptA